MENNIENPKGKYYIYHIFGKKIGVTRNLNKRVTIAQGYQPGEYEVLESSDDINYVSDREAELQILYGYKVDRDSYKKVTNKNKKQKAMKLNVTDQTTTFPCPVSKLKGLLMDNVGYGFTTQFGTYRLNNELIDWIVRNAQPSMFNKERSFVYNKAMAMANNYDVNNINVTDPQVVTKRMVNDMILEAMKTEPFKGKVKEDSNIYHLIREWATERGIYKNGDSKTQYVKLMEESGELAQAILKQDKAEIKDAIGDMIVVLTNLAFLEGFFVEDCINSAYNEIKNRKGSMQNGTFVKNTTSTPSFYPGTSITIDEL
jgi:NTP pyrophosphatase (non-canonical NTP hydrolase)